MASQQIDPIIPVHRRVGCLQSKRDAELVRIHIHRAPIIIGPQSNPYNPGPRSSENPVDLRTVAIDQEPSLGWQQLRQPALFLRHTLEVAEKLQMFAPDAGEEAELRLNQAHQRGQLARMIGPDFHHGGLVRRVQV